jgi:hypothetical protein
MKCDTPILPFPTQGGRKYVLRTNGFIIAAGSRSYRQDSGCRIHDKRTGFPIGVGNDKNTEKA